VHILFSQASTLALFVDQIPALAGAAADKGGASGAGITNEDFITVRRGHSDVGMSAFVH
jgi:hypothetical protein